MMYKLVAAAAIAVPIFAGSAASSDDPHAAFHALVVLYEAYLRREDPITAGLEDDAEALKRLPDVTPEGDARRTEALKAFQARLDAVSPAALTPSESFDRAYMTWQVGDALDGQIFDTARMPFENDSGFHTLADYLARTTTLRTQADADAWIARLHALPKYLDDNLANCRRGFATGWTQPKLVVDAILDTARRQAATPPADDVLLLPFKTASSTIRPDELAALKVQALRIVTDEIRPRQQAFVTFLEAEYLPKARVGLGIGSSPGGAAYYAYQVRHHTTTTLTPDEIHEIGVKEVARIRARMETVMKASGFTGSFPQFLTFLRTDPRFYPTSREALLEKASEIAKRADDKLPGLFATLPRLSYGVRPVPADQEEGYTTGRYFPGSPKLGIAGGYLVNTSHLDQRALYELPALTLHEAVPGHHIQIALAQELNDLAYFRRNGDATAFVEGWALYAEFLGEEAGLYRDNYELFGRLSYEMWRACRLVADTGIHALGWSLEQARACFTDNTALSPHNIQTELERYVSWPGQALAYKIGEIRIKALRQKAEAALGARFNLRRFHDAVLLAGAMPLDMLGERIDAWVASESARQP